MFYIDETQFRRPATNDQNLIGVLIVLVVATAMAAIILRSDPWYVVGMPLLVLLGILFTAYNAHRYIGCATVTTQPTGQRHKLILLWSGMGIFYFAMFADTFLIERVSSIPTYRGVPTTVGSVVFYGFIYRIWWIDRQSRRIANSEG